tara:strand:- start:172 stop:393 length:222 start_codon:yes stop_codon:yes gene_type:complete
MNNYIRKISVGADYKNAMHYIVGQQVMNGSYEIAEINQEENSVSIWVKKGNEIIKWKDVSNNPIIIEYNLQAI